MTYYTHYVHYTHYILISIESFAIVAVVSDDEFHGPIGDEQVLYLKNGTLLFMSDQILFLIDSIMIVYYSHNTLL